MTIDAGIVTDWRKPYRHPGRVELAACRRLRALAASVPANEAIVDLGARTGRATAWILLGAQEGHGAHVTTAALVESRDVRIDLGEYMDRVGATSAEHTLVYDTPSSVASYWGDWGGVPVGLLRHSGHGDVAEDLRAWLPHLAEGAVVVVHEAGDPRSGVVDAAREVFGEGLRTYERGWLYHGADGWANCDPQVIPWVYKGRARRARGLLIAQKSTSILPSGPQTVVNATSEDELVTVPEVAGQDSESEEIPKIGHRIWLEDPPDGDPDPIPEEFSAYGEQWADMHPGWEIREWRSYSDLPPLVNQDLFDHAREVCPKDWKRFQADLLRLELLYQFGGVYVDTDVQPLKPFDDLLDRQVLVAYSPHRDRSNRKLLTQAVLGSTPGHPWMKACIDAVPAAVKRYAGKPLAQMIGPHHITRVWRKGIYGFDVLDADLFYPQHNEQRDAGAEPDLDGAYAWHRWNSTLRKQGKGLG